MTTGTTFYDLASLHRGTKAKRAQRLRQERLMATFLDGRLMMDPNHTSEHLSGDVDVEYEAHRIAQGFLSSRGQ